MFGGSWVIDTPPTYPRCEILPTPDSEAKCYKPCTTGRTALDRPICEECYEAIREP